MGGNQSAWINQLPGFCTGEPISAPIWDRHATIFKASTGMTAEMVRLAGKQLVGGWYLTVLDTANTDDIERYGGDATSQAAVKGMCCRTASGWLKDSFQLPAFAGEAVPDGSTELLPGQMTEMTGLIK